MLGDARHQLRRISSWATGSTTQPGGVYGASCGCLAVGDGTAESGGDVSINAGETSRADGVGGTVATAEIHPIHYLLWKMCAASGKNPLTRSS